MYIIGNGFDASLDLKTKYSDFLKDEKYFQPLVKSKNSLGNALNERNKKAQLEKNWVDIEIAIGEIINHYRTQSTFKKDIIYKEYLDLVEALRGYLLDASAKIYIDNQTPAFKFFAHSSRVATSIYTFNYTKSADALSQALMKYKKYLSRNVVVKHMHGNIESKNIVFGCGNDIELKGDDIAFIKKSCNPKCNPPDLKSQLKNAPHIYMYGVSLGETDEDYFKDFFHDFSQQTIEQKVRKKLYISYYQDETEIFDRMNKMCNGRMAQFRRNVEIITVNSETLEELN